MPVLDQTDLDAIADMILGRHDVTLGCDASGNIAGVAGGVGGNVVGDVEGNVQGSVDRVTASVGGNVDGDVLGGVIGDVATVGGQGPPSGWETLMIDGSGCVTAESVTGNVVGSIEGNVDGDVVGNVAGSVDSVTNMVTAESVQGDITGNLDGRVLGGGASSFQAAGVWAYDQAGGNIISAAGVKAQADQALADYHPPTKAELDAAVAPLALEANVEGHVTSTLTTYDPPTKAELDAAELRIIGADADSLESLSDQLDGVSAKTDQIGSAQITYTSPARASGALVIYVGDNYLAADGRAVQVIVTDYAGPSLAAATAKFRVAAWETYEAGAVTAEVEVAADISVDATTVTLKADLSAAQTAALAPSPPDDWHNYAAQWVVTTAGGSVFVLADGRMTVRNRVGAKPA